MQKRLYVVFSATPLGIGKMIRTVTGEKYNHVSISFDPQLKSLYSYARYYKHAPFYGGFVKENCQRYRNGGRTAQVSVCAVPITPEQEKKIKSRLMIMKKNPKIYRYNLLSALTATVHRRVLISGCYTCVEFAALILSDILPEISGDGFYSVCGLERMLSKYRVFRGDFPVLRGRDEEYEKKIPVPEIFALTVYSDIAIIANFLREKEFLGRNSKN